MRNKLGKFSLTDHATTPSQGPPVSLLQYRRRKVDVKDKERKRRIQMKERDRGNMVEKNKGRQERGQMRKPDA